MDINSIQEKIKEKSKELKNLQAQVKQQTVTKSVSTLKTENSQILNEIAAVTIKIGMKNDRNAKHEVSQIFIQNRKKLHKKSAVGDNSGCEKGNRT